MQATDAHKREEERRAHKIPAVACDSNSAAFGFNASKRYAHPALSSFQRHCRGKQSTVSQQYTRAFKSVVVEKCVTPSQSCVSALGLTLPLQDMQHPPETYRKLPCASTGAKIGRDTSQE